MLCYGLKGEPSHRDGQGQDGAEARQLAGDLEDLPARLPASALPKEDGNEFIEDLNAQEELATLAQLAKEVLRERSLLRLGGIVGIDGNVGVYQSRRHAFSRPRS